MATAPPPTTLPPFQHWLLQRRAPQMMGISLKEIEWLFEPMLRGYNDTTTDLNFSGGLKESRPLDARGRRIPPFDKRALEYVLELRKASYTMSHTAMKRCVDKGIWMWDLNDKRAVGLLFAIDTIWQPMCRVGDGNVEYLEEIFGDCTYWDELLKNLKKIGGKGTRFVIGADATRLDATEPDSPGRNATWPDALAPPLNVSRNLED